MHVGLLAQVAEMVCYRVRLPSLNCNVQASERGVGEGPPSFDSEK